MELLGHTLKMLKTLQNCIIRITLHNSWILQENHKNNTKKTHAKIILLGGTLQKYRKHIFISQFLRQNTQF